MVYHVLQQYKSTLYTTKDLRCGKIVIKIDKEKHTDTCGKTKRLSARSLSCKILTLRWPQHNIYVNHHTHLQTKVMLFFPVHSSCRLQKELGSKTP